MRTMLKLMLIIGVVEIALGPANEAVRRELPLLESANPDAASSSAGTEVGSY